MSARQRSSRKSRSARKAARSRWRKIASYADSLADWPQYITMGLVVVTAVFFPHASRVVAWLGIVLCVAGLVLVWVSMIVLQPRFTDVVALSLLSSFVGVGLGVYLAADSVVAGIGAAILAILIGGTLIARQA